MVVQIPHESVISKEEKLVKLIEQRYRILRTLYSNRTYTLTELQRSLAKRPNLGNLSRYIGNLEENSIVLKEDNNISLSRKAQKFISSFIELERTEEEKLWMPEPEEVGLCLEALEARETKEMYEAFLSDLGSILKSGYWDARLKKYFTKALSDPMNFEKDIMKLLQAQPENSDKINAYLKTVREEIYYLVNKSDELRSLAFRVYVDVSEDKEVLDKIDMALDGEDAENIIFAVHGYCKAMYKKYGVDFKRLLLKALKHEREIVKSQALEIMKMIVY